MHIKNTLLTLLLTAILPVSQGLSAHSHQKSPLWKALFSSTEPKLVKLVLLDKVVAHIPRIALEKFKVVKDFLDEFPNHCEICLGKLLNISKENQEEVLTKCIEKVLLETIEFAISNVAPDKNDPITFEDAEALGLPSSAPIRAALQVRILLALGFEDLEDNKASIITLIQTTRVWAERKYYLKLGELLGFDNWEFGRLIFKYAGFTDLLIYMSFLDINKNDYIESILGKNPNNHPVICDFISQLVLTDSYDSRLALSEFIKLKCFDFNQLYQECLQSPYYVSSFLRNDTTGRILLSHCLARDQILSSEILLRHMCEHKINPKPSVRENGTVESIHDDLNRVRLPSLQRLTNIITECLLKSFSKEG